MDLKLVPVLSLLSLSLATFACAPEGSEFDPDCDDGQCDVSGRRRGLATTIRDSAAQVGMTNAVLLAGIGQVETTLAHCWRDAKWACKGPASASCGGGPVIAGASDGACSLERGGLGMFQFDAGTYSQTISQYGRNIVTLEGNTNEVVPYLVTRAVESVPGINTDQEALAWMNSIRPIDGDPEFEKWLEFISWRFNGCKGCTSQENKYRKGTHQVEREMGVEFWGNTGGGSGGGTSGSFIGTDCSDDEAICDFSVGGQAAECLDWFDEGSQTLAGFCSTRCQGTCPDQTGFAATFCADLRGNPGSCASMPAAANDFCSDMPGTTMQVVPRFVGNSGSQKAWRAVCAPPGNAILCDGGQGVGECIDTDLMQCGSSTVSGLCPGGANIQCCAP